MNTSEDIADLATALSKAQAVMAQPSRNSVGQARGGKYKYADLGAVFDAVKKALAENGLSILQLPQLNGDGFVLVTRLMHSSGQWIEATYPLPTGVTSQEMGSAITYGRRYSLSAILGVASEDDDDGAQATTPAQRPRQQASDTSSAPTGQDNMVCPIHGVRWFKSGRMTQLAHAVPGKPWCNKADVEAAQGSQDAPADAQESPGEEPQPALMGEDEPFPATS